MSKHQLPSPSEPSIVSVQDMVEVTTRLNSLLLQESALLAQMKVKDLEPLQEEKFALSSKLESYHRALLGGSEVHTAGDPNVRDTLLNLADGLAATIEENMRLTALAQTVNRNVMQTFVEALAEQQRVHTYSARGHHAPPPAVTVSLNINERA